MTDKTNAELADEIERHQIEIWPQEEPVSVRDGRVMTDAEKQQILAALRRQPERVVYQCPRCATSMEVDPTAKPSEHQPSSDMALVPREPTVEIMKAMADCYDATWGYARDSGVELLWAHKSYIAALAAAEAEGKPR